MAKIGINYLHIFGWGRLSNALRLMVSCPVLEGVLLGLLSANWACVGLHGVELGRIWPRAGGRVFPAP